MKSVWVLSVYQLEYLQFLKRNQRKGEQKLSWKWTTSKKEKVEGKRNEEDKAAKAEERQNSNSVTFPSTLVMPFSDLPSTSVMPFSDLPSTSVIPFSDLPSMPFSDLPPASVMPFSDLPSTSVMPSPGSSLPSTLVTLSSGSIVPQWPPSSKWQCG